MRADHAAAQDFAFMKPEFLNKIVRFSVCVANGHLVKRWTHE